MSNKYEEYRIEKGKLIYKAERQQDITLELNATIVKVVNVNGTTYCITKNKVFLEGQKLIWCTEKGEFKVHILEKEVVFERYSGTKNGFVLFDTSGNEILKGKEFKKLEVGEDTWYLNENESVVTLYNSELDSVTEWNGEFIQGYQRAGKTFFVTKREGLYFLEVADEAKKTITEVCVKNGEIKPVEKTEEIWLVKKVKSTVEEVISYVDGNYKEISNIHEKTKQKGKFEFHILKHNEPLIQLSFNKNITVFNSKLERIANARIGSISIVEFGNEQYLRCEELTSNYMMFISLSPKASYDKFYFKKKDEFTELGYENTDNPDTKNMPQFMVSSGNGKKTLYKAHHGILEEIYSGFEYQDFQMYFLHKDLFINDECFCILKVEELGESSIYFVDTSLNRTPFKIFESTKEFEIIITSNSSVIINEKCEGTRLIKILQLKETHGLASTYEKVKKCEIKSTAKPTISKVYGKYCATRRKT